MSFCNSSFEHYVENTVFTSIHQFHSFLHWKYIFFQYHRGNILSGWNGLFILVETVQFARWNYVWDNLGAIDPGKSVSKICKEVTPTIYLAATLEPYC